MPVSANLSNPVNRAHPLNAGLSAWLLPLPGRMGGSRLYDLAGPNHGVLTSGGTWLTSGPPGDSAGLTFAAPDYVTVPAAAANQRPFSLSLWVKFTGTGNGVIWECNGNSGFSVQTVGGSPSPVSCWVGGATNGVSTTAGVGDGLWHRVIFSFGASTAAAYVDGKASTSLSGSQNAPTYAGAPVYVGSRAGSFGFGGSVGGLRFYARELTASDARFDYQECLAGYPGTLNRLARRASFLLPMLPAIGTGAATLKSVTAAGTGTLSASATGSPTLKSVLASGTGTLTTSAAGTPTLKSVLASGTGTVSASATGAATLKSVTAAGVGSVGASTGVGAATLRSVLAAGVGSVTTADPELSSCGTDVMSAGVAWLKGQLQSFASKAVVYQRGTAKIAVCATPGRKFLSFQGDDGGVRMEWTDRDFIVPYASLTVTGTASLPERGDRIRERVGDQIHVYEVTTYGSAPAWQWSDPYRTLIRIHTRYVMAEDV